MVKEAIQKTTPLEGRRQCNNKLTYGWRGAGFALSHYSFRFYQWLNRSYKHAKNQKNNYEIKQINEN